MFANTRKPGLFAIVLSKLLERQFSWELIYRNIATQCNRFSAAENHLKQAEVFISLCISQGISAKKIDIMHAEMLISHRDLCIAIIKHYKSIDTKQAKNYLQKKIIILCELLIVQTRIKKNSFLYSAKEQEDNRRDLSNTLSLLYQFYYEHKFHIKLSNLKQSIKDIFNSPREIAIFYKAHLIPKLRHRKDQLEKDAYKAVWFCYSQPSSTSEIIPPILEAPKEAKQIFLLEHAIKIENKKGQALHDSLQILALFYRDALASTCDKLYWHGQLTTRLKLLDFFVSTKNISEANALLKDLSCRLDGFPTEVFNAFIAAGKVDNARALIEPFLPKECPVHYSLRRHIQLGIQLYQETNFEAAYKEYIEGIQKMNALRFCEFQELPSQNHILHDAMFGHLKALILYDANQRLGFDKKFLMHFSRYDAYQHEGYIQLATKYAEQLIAPEKIMDLFSIIIFMLRRMQRVLIDKPEQADMLKETQEDGQRFRRQLAEYSAKHAKAVAMRAAEEKRIILEAKAESKEAILFDLDPLPAKIITSPTARKPDKLDIVVPAPLVPKPKTELRKSRIQPFRSSDLKNALERKRADAAATAYPKSALAEIKTLTPGERYRAQQKNRAERAQTKLAILTKEQLERSEERKKYRIAARVTKTTREEKRHTEIIRKLTICDITHTAGARKPMLPGIIMRYATRISPLPLTFIGGGSVRQAIEDSWLPEGKASERDEFDVDIRTYRQARLQTVFPRSEYKLISGGRQLVTAFPLSPNSEEVRCSVQIWKGIDLNNLNTIEKSTNRVDFTINTFLARVDAEGNTYFYSPLGERALNDLRARRLVVVHPGGPDALFQENPICMLRALTFCLVKKYTSADNIFPALCANVTKFFELPLQVVNVHLTKLITHGNLTTHIKHPAFLYMFKTLFPELQTAPSERRHCLLSYIDKLSLHSQKLRKPIPLTKVYSVFLFDLALQIAIDKSPAGLLNMMDKLCQQNQYIKLSFSRMSAQTRQLILQSAIEEFGTALGVSSQPSTSPTFFSAASSSLAVPSTIIKHHSSLSPRTI